MTSPAFDFDQHPHRRRNPLSGEWVVVSPQRTQRPWQGSTAPAVDAAPTYDPSCYLCPGNHRAGEAVNPQYSSTLVFDNDFPALLPDAPAARRGDPLFGFESARGLCRVICFSPRHDLALGGMDPVAVRAVVDLWADQHAELSGTYRFVQIFETRGELCGASNPHPHGQLWASDFLPTEPSKELEHQRRYLAEHGTTLLCDYATAEIERAERVVELGPHWVVVVPYWAYWPYETLVLPRRAVSRLDDLTDDERDDLVAVLQRMLVRFDALFGVPFPYRSGWHSAPSDAVDDDGWQLHAHYHPPLLRSATVAKVPGSYEWLASTQRDLTAELAASHLRDAGAGS